MNHRTFGLPGSVFAATGLLIIAPTAVHAQSAQSQVQTGAPDAGSNPTSLQEDLSFANLTSYSQWRQEDVNQSEDLDQTGLPIFQLGLPIFNSTISQEFLLASKPGTRLQWTAGIGASRSCQPVAPSERLPFAHNEET